MRNHLFAALSRSSLGLLIMSGCAAGPALTPPAPVNVRATVSAERQASRHLTEQGRAAVLANLYDQAADFFQEAIQVDPGDGAPYFEMARLQQSLGHAAEARSYFEKSLTLLKRDPDWSQWEGAIHDFENQR